jgi:hypothetical protein
MRDLTDARYVRSLSVFSAESTIAGVVASSCAVGVPRIKNTCLAIKTTKLGSVGYARLVNSKDNMKSINRKYLYHPTTTLIRNDAIFSEKL